jgi:hypothetical protein
MTCRRNEFANHLQRKRINLATAESFITSVSRPVPCGTTFTASRTGGEKASPQVAECHRLRLKPFNHSMG